MTDVPFRRALGEFATGVAVITAQGQGEDLIGMTMSSFNSVSLDPPLVLFSVDRKANSLPAMLQAKGFAVNILAREQENISNRFAKALSDKWADVKRTVGHAEAPLITGALAHFECEPYANYDGWRPCHFRRSRPSPRGARRQSRAAHLLPRPLPRRCRRNRARAVLAATHPLLNNPEDRP